MNQLLVRQMAEAHGPNGNYLAKLRVHDILTALRGPDVRPYTTDAGNLKYRFTIPIRCWVYGDTVDEVVVYGSSYGNPPPSTVDGWRALLSETDNLSLPGEYHHYIEHIRSAISAIIRVESDSDMGNFLPGSTL